MNDLENMKKEEIKQKVAFKMEGGNAKEETLCMALQIVGTYKNVMEQEDYTGGEMSRIWFRARTNCLWLGDRQREQYEMRCPVCKENAVVEDLPHFILVCKVLEEKRGACLLQRPRFEDRTSVIGEFLYGQENVENKKKTIVKMWNRRCNIEKEENEP